MSSELSLSSGILRIDLSIKSCEFHLVTLADLKHFSDSNKSAAIVDFLTNETIVEAFLRTLQYYELL